MNERNKTIIIGLVSLIGMILLTVGAWVGISAIVRSAKQSKCAHIWESEVIVAQAGGIEGETLFTCTECGLEKTEKQPALEHDYSIFVAQRLATCTEDGYGSYYKCSYCGGANGAFQVEKKLGHMLAPMTEIAATCTTAGSTGGVVCVRKINGQECGHVFKEPKIIPAQGHFKVWVKGYEATCEHEGLTDGKMCYVCNELFLAQQVIPPLEHDVGEDGKCKHCGEEVDGE